MKYSVSKITFRTIAVAALFSIAFSACQKDDLTTDFTNGEPMQNGTAKIRFIHAAADLNGISVRFNENSVVGDSLRYKNFSGYTDVAIGSTANGFKLDMIALLDSSNGQSGDDLREYFTPNKDGFVADFVQTNFLFQKDQKYVCFIFDSTRTFTGPVLDPSHAALYNVVTENYPAPPSDSCWARFINLCESAAPVDLVFTNNSTNQITTIANVSFAEFSNYSMLLNGNYNLDIQQAGSSLTSRSNIDMQSGKAYTMYLRGIKGVSGDKELQLEIITNGE